MAVKGQNSNPAPLEVQKVFDELRASGERNARRTIGSVIRVFRDQRIGTAPAKDL
jgi:hypothetical protein